MMPAAVQAQPASGLLSRAWGWVQAQKVAHTGGRRLQVIETVSLGEKRFVSVVKVDGIEFLVGGGSAGVAMLSQLAPRESFEDALKKALTASVSVAAKPARRAPARA